jgi:hypothetical protein
MSITHYVTRTFAAGGTTEYPTGAEPIYGPHEGLTHEAGDGTPTNVWTGSKRRWKYTWDSPRPEIIQRWVARYTARSTFSHTDIEGSTHTALIPVGGLRFTAQFVKSSSTAAGTTYPLEVEVWEV